MTEPTKTLTVRVSPEEHKLEEHKLIKVYIANKGVTAQDYIKRLIEDDMQKSKAKEERLGEE